MAWRRPGDKPSTEPMMVRSLAHICVTRPQRVNKADAQQAQTIRTHAYNSCKWCSRLVVIRVGCIVAIYGYSMYAFVLIMTHYTDVIMGAMVSLITSLKIVYSAVYSGADRRKHQSSASLAFVRGIHRWLGNYPHKGPVTRKMFPFDDVIMSGALGILIYWNQLFALPLLTRWHVQ